MDLSNNKLSEFGNFTLPSLEYLDLSKNKLDKINETWQGHPNIKIIKSIDTKIKSLAVFKNMPRLEELYVQNNNISTLVGLEGVPELRKLNIRHNKIEKIEEEGLPELPNLQYLNLRTNRVPSLDDVFRLFENFKTLTDINLLNCPVETEYSSMNILVADILAKNAILNKPGLTRFCKIDITDKHRLEAVYLAKYKWEKAEE